MKIKLFDVAGWLADLVYGEDRKDALNSFEMVLGWNATAVIKVDGVFRADTLANLVNSAQYRTCVMHTRNTVLFEDAADALQVYLKWC